MSPVVVRKNGFKIVIHVTRREHGPAHVHVERAGKWATFWLADASLRDPGNTRSADVSRAQTLVAHRRRVLLDYWEMFHDED